MSWSRATYRKADKMAYGADPKHEQSIHLFLQHLIHNKAHVRSDGMKAGLEEGRTLGLQKGFEIGEHMSTCMNRS